jgi:DNA-binding NarL/FixJ family response regulator
MIVQALLVDPHPIVRKAVKEVLKTAYPFIRIKEFSGGQDLLREICGFGWAFVIMDIHLPDQNAIGIIKKAKARCPMTPIIVFSMYPETQSANRALRAGALAYLSKDRSVDDLIDTVGSALGVRQPQRCQEATGSQHTILSRREVQVLKLFAQGLSRSEMAKKLRISEKTVSTYKSQLVQKLELRNFAELIHYALGEGIAD